MTFSRGLGWDSWPGLVAMLALSRPRLLGRARRCWGPLSPLVLPQSIVDRVTFAFSCANIFKSAIKGAGC